MKSKAVSSDLIDKILDMALSWELDAQAIARELNIKISVVKNVLRDWNEGYYKTR